MGNKMSQKQKPEEREDSTTDEEIDFDLRVTEEELEGSIPGSQIADELAQRRRAKGNPVVERAPRKKKEKKRSKDKKNKDKRSLHQDRRPPGPPGAGSSVAVRH